MCKFCEMHNVGDRELSNEVVIIGEIQDGDRTIELGMFTYLIEDNNYKKNELILQDDVMINGLRYTVHEEHIPIKYCPFCGKEL